MSSSTACVQQADGAPYGPNTTADEVLEGVNLQGKTIVITGANTGIGLETARALVAKGASVIITTRSAEKGADAVAKIKATATGPNVGNVRAEVMELSSLASVRACAKRLLDEGVRIHYFINNAGVALIPFSKTEDGFETAFGVNHLGHFVFTNLLAPALVDGGRVVNLSSVAVRFANVDFEDIMFEKRPYDKLLSYGQSKTANALFSIALNKRLAKRGIEVFSVHPGAIKTDIFRQTTDDDWQAFEGMNIVWKSLPAGASTTVYAMLSPSLTRKGGAFLGDCKVWDVDESEIPLADGIRAYAQDADAAEKLWSVSEELVGQKFEF